MRFEVGLASEIPPGSTKMVYPFSGKPGIGVFNVAGSYYALRNHCPHMGAPLCKGVVTGTTTAQVAPDGRLELQWIREGEILKCPWHRWEFEIATGRTVFQSRSRAATYEVWFEDSSAGEKLPRVETYPVVLQDAILYVELSRQRQNEP